MVVSLQGKRLIIVGAGVAGSIAALLVKRRLSSVGDRIVVYEATKRYRKPCGEAMPAWLLKVVEEYRIPLPKTLYKLRAHTLEVAGACRQSIEGVEWVIIDKRSWVEELRRRIRDIVIYRTVNVESVAKNTSNIVFDARGPFVGDKSLLIWQAYADCHHSDSTILHVTVKPFGLVWVFPRSKFTCNVGGGFIGVNEAHELRERAKDELKRIADLRAFTSENYSIIRIPPTSVSVFHYGQSIVRLGEAAGLVMSLGGEGIRPAILSAVAAASATNLRNETICFNRVYYMWKIRNIILQSWLQKKLFETIVVLPPERICKLLKSVGESTMREWFKGRLGLRRILLELPKILFSIA